MLCFGMPALIELDTVEETVSLCAELGLDFVELNTNFPLQQIHKMDPALLNRLAEQYGIGYTIHLNDDLPVADFNPGVAKAYCQSVLDAIAFAKKIGCKVLNLHIAEGAHYTTPARIVYFYEAYKEEYLQGMAAFRDACEAAVGSSGIRICMENSKAYFGFQKEALDLLLESPVFFILLGAWVEDSAPTFGQDQTVSLEKARCVRDTGQGLSLWEAELEITYWEDV